VTVSFATGLAAYGDQLAVVTPDGTRISYRALAERVANVAAALGPVRRLVLVEASNDLGALVAYLAALAADHPVLLVPAHDAERNDPVVAQYDPDVVCAAAGNETIVVERRAGTRHNLHRELCLLLSTSGSTGSPKLVRLSHANVDANADAIASYLDIRATDRVMTTLPMSYCYGLSVVNSHLARGATLLLSNASVIDDGFWERFAGVGATAFAGVPYTFELLDRVGFEHMDLPSLRYVTQAGGRLPPDVVRRYADIGTRAGWQLFVMYGQTEATARMAYVPPTAVHEHPDVIGVPIPGGSFELEPIDCADSDTGELVYRGPNVMLGYATEPEHLAAGRTVDRLRTGDIARRTADGFYEIVGRTQRFVKPFGLRIDLEHLERVLDAAGITATCEGDDRLLAIAVRDAADVSFAAEVVGNHTNLPAHCIQVFELREVPRLTNGKVNHQAVLEHGRTNHVPAFAPHDTAALYAAVLRRDDVGPDDSFVSLHGDSLSYVEASMCLEDALGYVPDGWHTMPVSVLDRLEPKRRRLRSMETGVVLRALAICAVVAHHTRLQPYSGGAHALLVIAGFNFARFTLVATGAREGRNALSIARVLLPTAAALAITMTLVDYDGLGKRLLLSNYIDPAVWRYWFVEVLVHLLVVLAVLFCIPWVRRRERAAPFGFALVLFATTAAAAYTNLLLARPHEWEYKTHVVAFVFVLGWLVSRATTITQKTVVSVLSAVTLLPFFDRYAQGIIVLTAVLVLIWVPSVRLPRSGARVVGVVAAASLYIYLAHFEVYRRVHVPAALKTTIAISAGLLVWVVVRAVSARVGSVAARVDRRSARRDEQLAGDGRRYDVFAGRRPHAHTVVVAAEHGRVGAGDEARVGDHL
jgi:acyl-CoA synthetase (AMP-forming)/AMP-acid ligase II